MGLIYLHLKTRNLYVEIMHLFPDFVIAYPKIRQ